MSKKPVIEAQDTYKGYKYAVLFQPLGHRCGYVEVPKGHLAFGMEYEKLDSFIDCYGGVTYARNHLIQVDEDSCSWWIGFDCSHYGDKVDLCAYKNHYGEEYPYPILMDCGTVKTMNFCIKECKKIIDQLITQYN